MNKREEAHRLKSVLGLSRNIVGVKFIYTEEEFNDINIKQVNFKMSYCNTVKLASKGKPFKANFENFYCKASARAFGLMNIDNDVASGRLYHSFRMYNSIGTAKNVQKNVTYFNHEIYGVVVQPLEQFENDPDIVIMIINPYQAMRVVQGYSYHYGIAKNIKLTGNQGLCSECTVTPYEYNDLNVSLLCANTRFAAKWNDEEMGVGMPYHMFDTVADGIMKTLNPSEPNSRKREILEKVKDKNLGVEIELGTSYYRSGK
ncbi:MAG: DUF169 domain-containing protein [Bacillota bacterium]